MIENDFEQLFDEENNQKFLVNDGVQLYFSNVFDQTIEGRVPTIKRKLRKILVDFCLCQTCMEINQKLNYIKIFYADPKSIELKGLLLQRFNQIKESKAIELSISIEGNSVIPPDREGKIKTYTGLTKLLFQEFIEETSSRSMVDNSPYDEMKTIIKQGNLAACMPLESIFRGAVD